MDQSPPKAPNSWKKHRDELFIAVQRLLPQQLCSRLLGKVADSKIPWLKSFLIEKAVHHYGIDLSEALLTETGDYESFNQFFTRHLKADARPIDRDPLSLVSPADGNISQIGKVDDGHIFQAKGHQFSTTALLGCDPETASRFNGGSFATIYLSPRDYHRVHMPFSGTLLESLYIPGDLFSVNETTANHVENLFARNERLCCLFSTDQGLMAVVLVGALFVAGIETSWQKTYRAGKLQRRGFNGDVALKKGQELGLFKFGSTAIVVSETALNWGEGFKAGTTCRMGEALGVY